MRGSGTLSQSAIENMPTSKKSKAKPAAKASKPAKAAKAKGAATTATSKEDAKAQKRKLGLRGAAPWAARHAAKHAAEARARAAEPPLPGSARATIRTPTGAEDIKQQIGALHNCLVQIKALRKTLHKSFYDIGNVLRDVQARKLYLAKGYGTFDAFLEREIDLGKTTSQRLVRITQVFLRDAALEFGMDRCINGLLALESVPEAAGSSIKLEGAKIPPPPVSTPSLPLRPPGR
jgi:hypothetical protein